MKRHWWVVFVILILELMFGPCRAQQALEGTDYLSIFLETCLIGAIIYRISFYLSRRKTRLFRAEM